MSQEAARAYWRFTVLWLIAGSALGVLCALSLLSPELLSAHPIFSYGRLVAAHRASIVHGALFAGVFAAAYTLLPKLTQAYVVQKRKSLILAWAGSLIVLAGVILILLGYGSGREYADLPPNLSFIFWFYLVMVAIDIATLLVKTRTIAPNPATGLLFLAAILPAVVYPFALPNWWGDHLFDAMRTWIGWRTIFMGCMTASALGIGIWHLGSIRPKVKIPGGIFVLGVILVVGLGPLMGIVHLLDAPIGVGLNALGAFAGILVATGLLLIVKIMCRGNVHDPPTLLYLGGLVGIAAAAIQGVVMVIPPIHTAFHFTTNTSAHAHLALGALMLIFLAGALLTAPRLARRRLVGSDRANVGVGWFMSGLILIVISQMSTGVLQAAAFSKGLSAPDWLPMFRWIQLGTLLGGVVALIGSVLIGRIVLKTLNFPLPSPVIKMESSWPVDGTEILEGGEG